MHSSIMNSGFSLIVLVFVLTATIHFVRCDLTAGDKVSAFLKKRFADYDRFIRPNYGMDKPVTVTVSGYVLDIFDIDERNQEFTVNLYLRHEWKDPRLEYTEVETGTDKLFLNQEYADKLWKVDSFIVNERESKGHSLISDNQFTRIQPDGSVLTSSRFTIKAVCKMELGWFPFDRHTCPLVIESYGHNSNDLVYEWKVNKEGSVKTAVGVSSETASIQFEIVAVNCRQDSIKLSSNSYTKLAVEFFFIRAATRYVFEVYFPASLITFIAFTTLLHATGNAKTRLQISIFLEGLLIILMALTARNMPPVSYQTALDFYLLVCLITITSVVTVNIAVCLVLSSSNESNGVVRLRSVTESNEDDADDGKEILFDTNPQFNLSKANNIFRIFIKLRLFIPFVFIVFNLMYWMIVLIGSSSFPEDFLILDKNV